MSKKIAINYEKGGVGKTTTAVNLSSFLSEMGYKVLLVDLDLQSYATHYLNMYDDNLPSIYEVMCQMSKAEDVIRKTDFQNLDMIPSSYRFRNMETQLMMMIRRQEYTLKKVLQAVEDKYDFILFDCPPNGQRVKENALAYADYVILPTIPDDFAIGGLMCFGTEFVDIKQDVNPNLEVLGILITLDEKTKNKIAYKIALQSQNIFPCFRTTIRKNTTLCETTNHHKPINYYDRKCSSYEDYRNLTIEILNKLEMEVR